MRKLLLVLLQLRKLLEQMLLQRQKLLLVQVLLQVLLPLELVQVLLRMQLQMQELLLLFCRKQPKRLPTGKRARVIFSCLYFQ